MSQTTEQKAVFTRKDEGAHPPGDADWWSESVFFSWYDEKAGLGGTHRIGQHHNQGTSNVWYGLMADDGWRFRHDAQDNTLTEDLYGPWGIATRSDGGSHRMAFEDGVLRFNAKEADTEVDLVIEDYHPMTEIWPLRTGAGGHVEESMAHYHFEASGRARGTVRAGDRSWEVDALCHRDHSWGPREWHGFTGHRWFVGSCGPDLAFSGLIAVTTGGFVQTGFVAREGEITHADHLDVLTYLEPDGLTHRGGEATFYLPGGEKLHFTAEPINGVMFQIYDYVEAAQLCRVRSDAGQTGYVYLEISLNTRLGDFPVQHTVGAAMVRGHSQAPEALPGQLIGLT